MQHRVNSMGIPKQKCLTLLRIRMRGDGKAVDGQG